VFEKTKQKRSTDMPNEPLASITKEWRAGIWPFRKSYEVSAEQVEMSKEYGGQSALARVTITVNKKTVHKASIPWPTPKGVAMLALQVYMLSKQPNYPHPEWQPVLERFARACEGFSTAGLKMYWPHT
jgi:hypothetical protein